jgi:hypothetical protein
MDLLARVETMKVITDKYTETVQGGFSWIPSVAVKTAKVISKVNTARKLAKASGHSSVSTAINAYNAVSTCGSGNVSSVSSNGYTCK